MPISTQIPAQVIEWEEEFFNPAWYNAPQTWNGKPVGHFDNTLQRIPASVSVLPSTITGINTLIGYSGANVGAVTRVYDTWQQRRCISITVAAGAGNRNGGDWRPANWLPMMGPASDMAPGATLLPSSVVGVFDVNMAAELLAGAPSWPDDTTGHYFQAAEGNAERIPGFPTLVPTVEGFGVFTNSDGAGGARFEYVSWDAGSPGAILERVPIVADVSLWNTIRFVIVSAASGREASVTVYANGTEVVSREFGSPQLARLTTSVPTTTGPTHRVIVGEGPDTFYYTVSSRFGRFTPAGVELQGQ